jgi:ABC-type multidrug transport system fused ATPase/permease subunit
MTPFQHAIQLLRVCLRPRRRLFLSTIVMVVLFNAIELLFPKLLQLYVDSVAGNPLSIWGIPLNFLKSDTAGIFLIPAALLTIAASRWAVTYFRAVYETKLGQGALFDLRSRIFNTMQNLSFAYHDASHSGTLISNVVEDVNYANMFFRRGFMLLIESVAYMSISYIIIFSICPKAALAFLVFLSSGIIIVFLYFKHGHSIYARTKEFYAKTVRVFTENMEGHLIVKGFGTSKMQQQKYNKLVVRLHNAQIKETVFSSCLTQSLAIIMLLGIPLVIGIALFEARAGRWEFTSGRLFLLFYLQTGMRMRAWGLARALELAMRFTITSERLGRLLESDAYLDDNGTEQIPDKGLQLDIDNVSFSYGDSGHSLHNISLSIATGSTIGLVGTTGSGKSTLALLLCRFYDPTQGRIILNGCDIRCYPLKELRNIFSLVFQDTFLFSASIRDNIAYGRADARFEDIVHAATVAEIHEHIMTMPEGYDTVIGERGETLSGGQRQRISIARAVLRKPRFLILDACTSALDTKTEKAIQESLKTLRETTTCVIIAHRFSSIERADVVYVMQQGRIAESGIPAELNAPGTIFSKVMQS